MQGVVAVMNPCLCVSHPKTRCQLLSLRPMLVRDAGSVALVSQPLLLLLFFRAIVSTFCAMKKNYTISIVKAMLFHDKQTLKIIDLDIMWADSSLNGCMCFVAI